MFVNPFDEPADISFGWYKSTVSTFEQQYQRIQIMSSSNQSIY